jgi:hypothetical protein
MAGQKKLNQAAKKAASDGKINGKEAKALMAKAAESGANAALAIANQASRGAAVNENAQRNTGLNIAKNGLISYDPQTVTKQLSTIDQMRVNYGVIPNPAPLPVNPKFTQNTAGTYTYLAGSGIPAAKQVKTTKPAAAADTTTTTTTEPEAKPDPNQALIDSINAQIAANATQAELYMGQINDLMASMSTANQQGGLSSIAPYAVTSTSVDPASGAKTTSAVAPRKKPTATDLSVDSLVSNSAGTGLNIAI